MTQSSTLPTPTLHPGGISELVENIDQAPDGSPDRNIAGIDAILLSIRSDMRGRYSG